MCRLPKATMPRKKQPEYPKPNSQPKPITSTRKTPTAQRLREEEDLDEQLILLPAAHSKPQNNLINAWDLRFWEHDPQYDPADPLRTSFTLDQWQTIIALLTAEILDPQERTKAITALGFKNIDSWLNFCKAVQEHGLPKWEDLPLTFPNLRFIVGACGTKFGKTYGTTIRLVKEAWENPEPTLFVRTWWVAPTYGQAENAMQQVIALLPIGTYKAVTSQGKMRITLLNPDGSPRKLIEFKSGDDPASLRGFAVDFFVMDECAQGMPEASYTSIMTTTTQTQGRGIFISTPNGGGWFKQIYQKGVKYYENGTPKFGPDNPDPNPEWFSVRMPTHANPHVKLEEVELKRKQLPDAIFRQEYLAQFVDSVNKVFKQDDIAAIFEKGAVKELTAKDGSTYTTGGIREPEPGHLYVVAADLGDKRDYTVITVMDRATKHVVYHERFQKRGWEHTKRRIIATATKYNRAYIIMDSTGVGDPIYDDLVGAGWKVDGYTISSNSKKRVLIEKLVVAVEQKTFSVPLGGRKYPSLHALKEELEEFEYHYNKDGRGPVLQYEAPSGHHDDCVLSLALAVWVADTPRFVYQHRRVRGV